MTIGVLLTSYRRPHTLRAQLEAVRAQTIKPDELIIWHNAGAQPDLAAMRGVKVVAANYNSGVWPRMAFAAYGFTTDYVCVFDDDTIPGKRWFDNCLLTMDDGNVDLCGANGVIFHEGREKREYVGANRNDEPTEVDIVGHSWFARRSVFCSAVGTPRPMPMFDTCGEDYHLSYAVQLHGGKTVVPAHPEGHPELYGSQHIELGADKVALWSTPGEEEKKRAVHASYLKAGWLPLALRECVHEY